MVILNGEKTMLTVLNGYCQSAGSFSVFIIVVID